MNATTAYDELVAQLRLIGTLNSVTELLDWDEQVNLPADSAINTALQPVVETMLAQTETKEAAGAHHR